MKYSLKLLLLCLALCFSATQARTQDCPGDGLRVDGVVLDPNGSAVVAAQVRSASGATTTTDASGRFLLGCLPPAESTLTVQATGFSDSTVASMEHARRSRESTGAPTEDGKFAHLVVRLSLARVDTRLEVGARGQNGGPGSQTISGKRLQEFADDPDDLQRQLQTLAAASGGAPGSARFTIDGFQNASLLPPKGSIDSIQVNPDSFSSEFEDPPYDGGQIEIITRPGADHYHGALFFTDSDGSFNATDPFSITATPAGKRRYGFELSGPVAGRKNDFSLALEKRDIDEFNVVNAVTLDANSTPLPLHQAVDAPQRLWIGSARAARQVTASDAMSLSFTANVNALGNQGVGGLTLPEAGFNSQVSEYDLRFSNTQTPNPNLLHQTHIGYTWKDTAHTPLSTAPQLQVAGFFIGGGDTSQRLNNRERDLEIDDDVLITHGNHSIKLGTQSLGMFVHDYDPDTFNGAFVFGGGGAPAFDANGSPTGQTTTINALEQYRRALQGIVGGTPTTYQLSRGTPLVPLTQWRFAAYAEDTLKLTPHVTASAGLRYNFQTTPDSLANFGPRAGLAWALDKKETWVLHLHGGIFYIARSPALATEVYRLNGERQQQALIYSPDFQNPLDGAPGSISVSTTRTFPHSLSQGPAGQAEATLAHDFPHQWHVEANYFYVSNWGSLRYRNINAPIVQSENGVAPDPIAALEAPRPIAPNENILQYQSSGHFGGHVFFAGLQQESYKHFNFFVEYVHFNFKTDTGRGAIAPQSSYSDRGETSRPDYQLTNQVVGDAMVLLPWKLTWSSVFDGSNGSPYNAVTGTDANGDGVFNDRPSYTTVEGAGVYGTRFGLLTTNAINGTVPRNIGTMPMLLHVDMNVSRAFKLGPQKQDSPRTLTLNARSANVFNHTNVSAVGTIVSSPTFSQSLAAETARRLELGVRFAF